MTRLFSKQYELTIKKIHDNFAESIFRKLFNDRYLYIYKIMEELNNDGYRLGRSYVSIYYNKHEDYESIRRKLKKDVKIQQLEIIGHELGTVKSLLYKSIYESNMSNCDYSIIIKNMEFLCDMIDSLSVKLKQHEIHVSQPMHIMEELQYYTEDIDTNQYINHELSEIMSE